MDVLAGQTGGDEKAKSTRSGRAIGVALRGL